MLRRNICILAQIEVRNTHFCFANVASVAAGGLGARSVGNMAPELT